MITGVLKRSARLLPGPVRLLLAVFLVLAISVGQTPATQVRQMSLAEIVRASGTIFSGQVLSTAATEVKGFPATRVIFGVDEAIRGVTGDTVTLIFFGGRLANGLPYGIAGMPVYRPGQQVVLLAYPESSIGLTIPVGVYQGHFAVTRGPAGLGQVTASGPRRRFLSGVNPSAGLGVTTPPVKSSGSLSFPHRVFMETLRELAETGPAAKPDSPGNGP